MIFVECFENDIAQMPPRDPQSPYYETGECAKTLPGFGGRVCAERIG